MDDTTNDIDLFTRLGISGDDAGAGGEEELPVAGDATDTTTEEVWNPEDNLEEVSTREDELEVGTETEEETGPKGRDYSGVGDDVVPLLKKMSKEAYAHFYPIAKNLQEGKLVQSDTAKSYLDHENAYVLSDEYTAAQQKIQEAYSSMSYLQQQLGRALSEEKRFQAYTTGPGGQVVLQEFDATPENVAILQKSIARNEAQYELLSGELPKIKDGHTKQFSGWRDQVNAVDKRVFGEKVPKSMEPLIAQAEALFPVAIRTHPATKVAAKAIALLHAMQMQSQKGPAAGAKGKAKPKAHAASASAENSNLKQLQQLINS